MSNKIQIKRSVSNGPPGSLSQGELAWADNTNTLYIGNAATGAVTAIAGSGVFATNPMTTLGDLIYGGASGAESRLAGDTSNTRKFLRSLSSGSTATAPAWDTLASGDIPTITSSKLSDFASAVAAFRLDQFANPTSDVSFNSHKITSLADPSVSTDAATKNYVDISAHTSVWKQAARVASTANVSVTYTATGGSASVGQITAAPNTLDSVSLALGDRILLKNQTTGAQNGIWVVSTVGTGSNGVWDRAFDFNSAASAVPGITIWVAEGTTNAGNGFLCSNTGVYNIGGVSGTSLTFVQFSGLGMVTVGNGLSQSVNTISVAGTANRISVSGSGVDISASYVGQGSITTLGTIGTGTWQGTTVAVGYGGTGATTLTGIVKGNGTSAFTAAVAGTDYLSPSSTVDAGTY